MATSTPFEVWNEAHRRVRSYDLEGFADLFSEEGVLELPFASGGMPRRLEGRDAIKRVFGPIGRALASSGGRIVDYSSVVVHETVDPEVIVVEFDLNGEHVTSGRTYQLSYIQVLRVRGGEVAFMRDYVNPEAVAAVAAG